MTDSRESEENASDSTVEPVKVDAPQEDIVEKGADGGAPAAAAERAATISVDAPDENHVEFSQMGSSDSTLAHRENEAPASDSPSSDEEGYDSGE